MQTSRTQPRYGNVKRHVHADGTVLDSGREFVRYKELILLQLAGEIADLRVHPRFVIEFVGRPVLLRSRRYPGGRKLTYVADFEYLDTNTCKRVIEDVKMASGHRTEVYKIKKALMEHMGHKIVETT